MVHGTYSERGFQVVASNALELVTGTQAASAGYVAENVRATGEVLHQDLARVSSNILQSNAALREVNQSGFHQLQQAIDKGTATAGALSVVNVAVQAAGFMAVSAQLSKVNGELGLLRQEVGAQAARMLQLQTLANAKLESLVQVAERSLHTQERILEALVQSRAGEAQQLIRQGWENLRHGYRDDAASRFERSLEYDNTVYLSHAMLADLYRERKDAARAESHYQRAIAFAGEKAPEIRVHAHLQYARFLEESARFSEAVRQVEEALRIQDRPDRRFYLAELKMAQGETDAALEALGRAIAGDANLFSAAFLSPRLAESPALAAFLVGIDRAVREPLLRELSRQQELLGAIERLAARAWPGEGDARTADLHATLDALAVRLASAAYQELKAFRGELERQASLLGHRGAELGDRLLRPVEQAAVDLRALASNAPSPRAPELSTGADVVSAGMSKVMVTVGYGLAALVGLAGLLSLSPREYGGGLVFLAISGAIAFGVSRVARDLRLRALASPKVTRRQSLEQHRAWWSFLARQEEALRRVQEDRAEALAKLEGGAEAERVWPAALRRAATLATPGLLPPPPWLQAARGTCSTCGQPLLEAAPECDACRPAEAPASAGGADGQPGGLDSRKRLAASALGLLLAGLMVLMVKWPDLVGAQGSQPSGRFTSPAWNFQVEFPCEPRVLLDSAEKLVVGCQDPQGRNFNLHSVRPSAESIKRLMKIPREGIPSDRAAVLLAGAHYREVLRSADVTNAALTENSAHGGPETFTLQMGRHRAEGRYFYGASSFQYLDVWYEENDRPATAWIFDSFKRLGEEPSVTTFRPVEPDPGPAQPAADLPQTPPAAAPTGQEAQPAATAPAPEAAKAVHCVDSIEALRASLDRDGRTNLLAATKALAAQVGANDALTPFEGADTLLRVEAFTRPQAAQGDEDAVLQVVARGRATVAAAEFQAALLVLFRRTAGRYCVHNVIQDRRLHCEADRVQALTFDWTAGGIVVERVQAENCANADTLPIKRVAYLVEDVGVSEQELAAGTRRIARP